MRQDGFKLSSKKTAILSFSLAILITLSAVFTFNAAGALYADNSFAFIGISRKIGKTKEKTNISN